MLTDAQREVFRRDMEAMIEQVGRLGETSDQAAERVTTFAKAVRGVLRIVKPAMKALRALTHPPRRYHWRTRRRYRLNRQRRF